jgi:hypothetical protein
MWSPTVSPCRRIDRKIDRKRMADGPGCGWWTRDDDGLSAQVGDGFLRSRWIPVDPLTVLDTQELASDHL